MNSVLIIDDEEDIRELLRYNLIKEGFDVDLAPDGESGLALLEKRPFDLVLLDVMMPERDGGRVLADLRNDLSLRYIPVILLTAIAREAQTLASTGGIRSTVLSKPVQLQELIQTIESHLQAAKTYNQLRADDSEETDSSSHFQELPDFEAEGEGPSGHPGRPVPNPSLSFSGQFPAREEAPPHPGEGSAFSFPSRPEHEKPGPSVW